MTNILPYRKGNSESVNNRGEIQELDKNKHHLSELHATVGAGHGEHKESLCKNTFFAIFAMNIFILID